MWWAHLNSELFTGKVYNHTLPALWLFSQDPPSSPLLPKLPDRAVVLAPIFCLVHLLLQQISKVLTRIMNIMYSWKFHCVHLHFTFPSFVSQTWLIFPFQEAFGKMTQMTHRFSPCLSSSSWRLLWLLTSNSLKQHLFTFSSRHGRSMTCLQKLSSVVQ